ncbi:MAG: geranylgeranyl reductase family protein [Candidatus Thorarchaeota archaeon]
MHDLVIVGGGPAGASCARAAALGGLDVLLIEKEVHPRAKLCAGVLTHRVADLVDFDIEPATELRFSGGRLYSRKGTYLDFTFDERFSGYLVKRPTFDKYLLERAIDAGVEVVQDTKAVGVEQTRSGIRVLTVGDSYKAHLLVGADGVNGVVAKQVGLRDRWESDKVGLCISADIPVEEDEIKRCMSLSDSEESIGVDIHFGIIQWGYGWCFPKKDELSVGIGTRMDMAAALKAHWKSFVKRVEEAKGLKFDLSQQSAFRVPIGAPKTSLVARRTMLVGDAAGLVSPLSGEGILYAMESGMIAAKVACEAEEMKKPSHVMEYGRIVRRGILRELSEAEYLANILYKSIDNIDSILQIVDEDTRMREYLTDFMAGTRPFVDIRKDIMKRMVTRHPFKAIRLRF